MRVRLDRRRQRAERRLRHSEYCEYSRPRLLRLSPDEKHSFELAAGSEGCARVLVEYSRCERWRAAAMAPTVHVGCCTCHVL